jgi:hypothetical protein
MDDTNWKTRREWEINIKTTDFGFWAVTPLNLVGHCFSTGGPQIVPKEFAS